jgi:adenosylcobinamide amidohydrolase
MAGVFGMTWEILAEARHAVVRRNGRFISVDLLAPHHTISTSARNGGQTDHLHYLINHQSCEAAGHNIVSEVISTQGEEAYHDAVCAQIGVPPGQAAVMGTAANMNYAAVVRRTHAHVEALAIVTAGVQTNATCAGDPAVWCETEDGLSELPHGTINVILVINSPVTVPAMARIVAVVTEAKSAALQRLAVPSCYSAEFATGTGTDQYCVAAPIEGGRPLSSASPHTKFGEIIGLAVREATLEALRWQNGLEASYTRSLFHALGRYGVNEQTILGGLAELLGALDFELFKKNSKSVFFEPQVGAAAYALAATLDRARHGMLPQSCIHDAVAQQAATLAANLASKPDKWPEFRHRLQATPDEPARLVTAAIALGWSEKWRRS